MIGITLESFSHKKVQGLISKGGWLSDQFVILVFIVPEVSQYVLERVFKRNLIVSTVSYMLFC